MKKIYLSGKHSNLFCLVDDEDYWKVSRFKWYLDRKGYAKRNRKYQKLDLGSIRMQSFILGWKIGFVVDHINNNKLDNQKINLRFITNVENIRRRGKTKRSSTGYKGVYFCRNKELAKDTVRYLVYIRVDKKLKTVGYFKDLREAVVAYNTASKKYHGDFGYQNPLP